jgi:hypothetical protein
MELNRCGDKGGSMRTLIALILLSPVAFAGTAYHVTTTGTSKSAGGLATPWNIHYALDSSQNFGGPLVAGDTIWVHAGDYNGPDTCRLHGTDGSPIVIRNYERGRAIIYGGTGSSADRSFVFEDADYVWLWGIEISSHTIDRVQDPPVGGGEPRPNCDTPYGIETRGGTIESIKIINCIIHDVNENNIWSMATNTEVYGNIVYNIGTYGTQGHAFYTQNSPGGRKVYQDNIITSMVDGGYLIHAYGAAGALDSITIARNIFVGWQYAQGVLYGGANDNHLKGAIIDSNCMWYAKPDIGYNMAGVDTPLIRGNISIGEGRPGLTVRMPKDGTISGNALFENPYIYDTVGLGRNYAAFDSLYPDNLTYDPIPVSGDTVRFFPNKYEPKRANVAIYNWDAVVDSSTVTVSSVFSTGDTILVLNAYNYFGDSPDTVVLGAGGTIKIPMSATRWTTAPIQGSDSISINHQPKFGAFVLLSPGVQGLSADTTAEITSDPSNTTKIKGLTAAFTITASGNPSPSYQWQRNAASITGATSASYTTPAVTLADNGAQYRCIVSNAAGSDTSASATLTVELLKKAFGK